MPRKVALDPDKSTWHPSILPGQVVLVSTVSNDGEPNIAPKSLVTMAALASQIVAFGCNVEHKTYRNIAATGEFVINVPAEPLAERVWSLAQTHGGERLKPGDLTLAPSQSVAPSIVEECRAHLECRLDSTKQYGNEVLIFGKIVAACIDADCQAGAPAEQYFRLRPIFFLEKGMYGTVDGAKQIGEDRATSHPLFLVNVGQPPTGRDMDIIHQHWAFLRDLRSRGCLLAGGPFGDLSGGMYLISAFSEEEADEAAHRDPLVRAGAPYTLKQWTRTF